MTTSFGSAMLSASATFAARCSTLEAPLSTVTRLRPAFDSTRTIMGSFFGADGLVFAAAELAEADDDDAAPLEGELDDGFVGLIRQCTRMPAQGFDSKRGHYRCCCPVTCH
eukprot:GHVU01190134.1.p2 GENE.GHVU01190134.1~~GHVU01190134.1.p2  ORF type:complete len:111 (-),score=13.14 GHVU01190134.1:243-575(-)